MKKAKFASSDPDLSLPIQMRESILLDYPSIACSRNSCPLYKSTYKKYGICCQCNIQCHEEQHHENIFAGCTCHDYQPCPCHPDQPFVESIKTNHFQDIDQGLKAKWQTWDLIDFPKVFFGIHRNAWYKPINLTLPIHTLTDGKHWFYHTREALNSRMQIHPDSKILCTLCGPDVVIEQLWPNFKETCKRLASFSFDYYSPDYSCYRNTAIAGIHWNFSRNLLVQDELQSLGCRVIPRISTLLAIEQEWCAREKPRIILFNMQLVSKMRSRLSSNLDIIQSWLGKWPAMRVVFYGLEYHWAKALFNNANYSFTSFRPYMLALAGRLWPGGRKTDFAKEHLFDLNCQNYLSFLKGEQNGT